MPTSITSTRVSSTKRRELSASPAGYSRHLAWWKKELPGLLARIDTVLAQAVVPQGPLCVYIEPRAVSFPEQAGFNPKGSVFAKFEFRFTLDLPAKVGLADIAVALQKDALEPLVSAQLWVREIDHHSAHAARGGRAADLPPLTVNLLNAVSAFQAAVVRAAEAGK
ncbi:hypothetical protein AB4Z52_12720 [Rhizobium sp. 2YAF20]|uniref:hypothetical protein n=1 Tax=Rhizobium sp. 2YAF20 TaxID=3233027 RepID=UPI003F9BC01A